ncbi:MAG: DUF6285 domain-containing protein, partial [Pseudomonadota bacterium]
MHDQPSVLELLQAVKSFIDESAAPQLKGHAAFHARVASNALSTAMRDLEQRPNAAAQERDGLTELLGPSDGLSLDDLNRSLSEKIKSGEMTVQTPGLLAHLKQTTMAQVEIDQP